MLNDNKGFGSDNHPGAHPEILRAMSEANQGHMPSYGTDSYSEMAIEEFRRFFGPAAQVFFVFNGTAANTLALKALVRSHHAILCSDVSHVNVDECGAPEFFTGAKLIPIATSDGKITVESIKDKLIRGGDQHCNQICAVTITQPTELGTLYSLEEIQAIANLCKEKGLFLHVDGARLPNAVVSLKSSFREMLVETGVDVISFGGTKNGFVFGEAVVFLNAGLATDFKYIRKQGLNLPSKSRFIAAQFLRYFKDDLWRDIAEHSNAMAKKLCSIAKEVPQLEVTQKVQANAVFVRLPRTWVKPLRKKHFFYIWDEKTFEARWMCSFDTTEDDLKSFQNELEKLKKVDSSSE